MNFRATLATLVLAAGLTAAAACTSGSATPTSPPPTPSPAPALEATITTTPTPRKPEETPIVVTYPTATPPPPATATPTRTPPTATPPPPTYTPTTTPTPRATPIASFTQEQLRQKLSSLEEILRTTEEPVVTEEGRENKEYVKKLTDAINAGYFLATGGRVMQNDNISLLLLSKKDFDKFIDQLPYGEATKTRMKDTFIGFAYGSRDLETGKLKYSLAIRDDRPPRSVFHVATREAGHALSEILNPAINGTTLESSALDEARASAFSGAIYRALEEFTGKKFLNYSLNSNNVAYIDDRLALFREKISEGVTLQNFPVVGISLLWAAADEMGMLKQGEYLSAAENLALFRHLLMGDASAKEYAAKLLNKLRQTDPELRFIRQHAVSRLIPNYPVEKEGPFTIEQSVLRP